MKILLLLIPFICFSQIGWDKPVHAACGYIITKATEKICYKITKRPGFSRAFGYAAGWGAGIGKEVVWDNYLGHGQASLADCLWTGGGSTLAITIYIPRRKKK